MRRDLISGKSKEEIVNYARVRLGRMPAPVHIKAADEEETREELLARLLDPELNLAETAKILNVCKMTVRRYTNRGILPSIRTAGNQRRFKLSAVLDFIDNYYKKP